MANSKISGLTTATTPLAGTEELALLQSNDKRIAVANFAAGAIKSNATTGVLQVTGPVAASTRVMTTPDANFTAARTDAAQSFTGDQTLSTGNLIQGTAAKGINFTANTPAAGMTSQLLNWYEEGTWTATMTGSTTAPTTPVTVSGVYTRVGRVVTITAQFADVNTTGASGNLRITGIPFAAARLALGSAAFYGFSATPAIATVNGSNVEFSNIIDLGSVAMVAGATKYCIFTITYTI
jgi:hypothetical protein